MQFVGNARHITITGVPVVQGDKRDNFFRGPGGNYACAKRETPVRFVTVWVITGIIRKVIRAGSYHRFIY